MENRSMTDTTNASAKNTPFLADLKVAFNQKIYKEALAAYRNGGEREARRYMETYTKDERFAPKKKAAPNFKVAEDGLRYADSGQHPANLPDGGSCLCPSHLSMVIDLKELRQEYKGNRPALALIKREQKVRDGLTDQPAGESLADASAAFDAVAPGAFDGAAEGDSPAPAAAEAPKAKAAREPKALTLPAYVEASVFFDGRMDRSKTPGVVLQHLGAKGGDRLVYHIDLDGRVTVTKKASA
jgi:hypothetical protein